MKTKSLIVMGLVSLSLMNTAFAADFEIDADGNIVKVERKKKEEKKLPSDAPTKESDQRANHNIEVEVGYAESTAFPNASKAIYGNERKHYGAGGGVNYRYEGSDFTTVTVGVAGNAAQGVVLKADAEQVDAKVGKLFNKSKDVTVGFSAQGEVSFAGARNTVGGDGQADVHATLIPIDSKLGEHTVKAGLGPVVGGAVSNKFSKDLSVQGGGMGGGQVVASLQGPVANIDLKALCMANPFPVGDMLALCSGQLRAGLKVTDNVTLFARGEFDVAKFRQVDIKDNSATIQDGMVTAPAAQFYGAGNEFGFNAKVFAGITVNTDIFSDKKEEERKPSSEENSAKRSVVDEE